MKLSSILSAFLFVSSGCQAADVKDRHARSHGRRAKGKKSPKSMKPAPADGQTDAAIKDLSWLGGTWYPNKVALTGYVNLMGNFAIDTLPLGSRLTFKQENPDGPATRFTAVYEEYLQCALLDLTEAECSGPNLGQGGTTFCSLNFVATSSFSEKMQEKLTVIGYNGKYTDMNGDLVPVKPSVSLNQKFTCDVSYGDNGNLFCDIEVVNIIGGGAQITLLATSQHLVKAQDDLDLNLLQVMRENPPVYSTVVAAVEAAGLVEFLSGPGPFTMFPPTNAAFDKLPAGQLDDLLKPENKDQLAEILKYHLVAANINTSLVYGTSVVNSVQGEGIAMVVDGGTITFNGYAVVIIKDAIANNGYVHGIDGVLIPPSMD